MLRPAQLLILAVGFLSAAGSLPAQDSSQNPPQNPDEASLPAASVRLEDVSLDSVQSDRILLNARLTLLPKRSVTLEEVSFSQMRLNDMPVYVAPIHQTFDLKKDEPMQLPSIRITVYFRDLASLDPVRRIIDEQKLRLAGQISAFVRANLIEKLALRSLHPKVVLPFNKEMPIVVPGGEIGRQAALTMLGVAQTASGPIGQILGSVIPGSVIPGRGGSPAWRSDLNDHQIQHLVLVHTSYTVIANKASYPMETYQLGFWIGPSSVLVTEEAVRPWEFDADAGMQLSDHRARLDKDSVAITVKPLSGGDANQAWTLSQGDFKVEFEGKPESDKVVTSGLNEIQMRQRASKNNYAVLRFRDGTAGSPAQSVSAMQTGWDRLAVFHLVRATSDSAFSAEVVFLPATSDGSQIRFSEQIDDSAFGSPVFTPDGAIGLLQDENAATLLSGMKHLPGGAQ
jgi:hypothetical protein